MYVAIVDGNILSARRTEEAAKRDLMEYRDMTPSEIKQFIKEGTDITVVDEGCVVEETIM